MVLAITQPALAVPPGHRLGSDEAPVFLEMWLDYQDADNIYLFAAATAVLNYYGGHNVQLIVKPFPISGGEDDKSFLAAEAGECLARQNEEFFWQWHNFMLSRSGRWSLDDIWQWTRSLAAKMPVDKAPLTFNLTAFTNCWKERDTRGIVGFYVAEGYLKEIENTPTTLVISRPLGQVVRFEGVVDYEQLAQAVENFLHGGKY